MSARSARYSHTFWHDLPLVPLRDTLLALQWLGAVFGSHVVWRGARMPVVNRVAPPRTSIVEMSDRR
jgi:ceramide glucosyltransferase